MAAAGEDRRIAIRIAAAIAIALLLLGSALFFFGGPVVAEHFEPGVGLKSAAVIAFVLTMVSFVVLAVAAGDGLLGELQFMIAAFAGFFFVCWLMIAWIF
jgi:hypothetical protein